MSDARTGVVSAFFSLTDVFASAVRSPEFAASRRPRKLFPNREIIRYLLSQHEKQASDTYVQRRGCPAQLVSIVPGVVGELIELPPIQG